MDMENRQIGAAFLAGLNKMADLLGAEMGKDRQKNFMDFFAPRVTLQEWVYACDKACEQGTFSKIPASGELLAYATEYREAQEQQARREAQEQRLRLEASPAGQSAKQRELDELRRQDEKTAQYWREEVARRQSLSIKEQIRLGYLNPPRAVLREMEDAEALRYVPDTQTVEKNKAALRQLKCLIEDKKLEEESAVDAQH